MEPQKPSSARHSTTSAQTSGAMRIWQPQAVLTLWVKQVEKWILLGVLSTSQQPLLVYVLQPRPCLPGKPFYAPASLASSVSTSTSPPAMGCSLMRFVMQFKQAGAQKWKLLISSQLPAKQWMIRRNSSSESGLPVTDFVFAKTSAIPKPNVSFT